MAAPAVSTSPVAATMQSQDELRPDLPRPYKCPLCDKAFHRLEHQTRHIRTHTGEKPHACQFPSCNKRFSRSDELTRHSRIHNNPNSRRGNKQHVAAAAAAAVVAQSGMYDTSPLPSISQHTPLHHTTPYHPASSINSIGHITHMNTPSQPQPIPQPTSPINHISSAPITMMPPPPKAIHSAPVSQLSSPNVSPPHSYSTYTSAPGSYMTRNLNGDITPATTNNHYHHRAMDINMLANAASEVERENSVSLPNHHLSLPARNSFSSGYHNHSYGSGRVGASLSSYHYSSNPASQPMSRSHSHEDDDHHRPHKKSRPGSPQSTAPPSPEFPHESTSPTPDHTPLATPSHSPRLRPMYYHHSGVQLPTLHHLSLHGQPPPALAPVEPSADGTQPYVPSQHSGLRISEIMEAGDGAQRKLPVPMVPGGGFSVRELADVKHASGIGSGHSSARVSEAGNDLHDRY